MSIIMSSWKSQDRDDDKLNTDNATTSKSIFHHRKLPLNTDWEFEN